MKQYLFIPLFALFIILTGCTTKRSTYIEKISFFGKKAHPKSKNPVLHEIALLIQKDTNASLSETISQAPGSAQINLYLTDKYLKISFNLTTMFVRTDSNLNFETTQAMQKIIPVLQKYPDIIIQVIGHAYDEGTPKEMQHYADLRAISVAELFFNSGLKQEILAKGCSDLIPKERCNLDKPHLVCSAKNRRVDLFIYTDKDALITKCR